MKTLLTIAVSAAAALGGFHWAGGRRPPAPAPSAGPTETGLAELREAVEEARAENARLAREIAEREGGPLPMAPNAGGVTEGELAAALERWRSALPPDARVKGTGRTPGGREARTSGVAQAPMAEIFALLHNEGLTDQEQQNVFQELRDAGRMDEYVAEAERRAAAYPDDPDLQVALGVAYLQKLFEVGNTPEAGTWAVQADQAFDRALELDDTNWGARFTKAVSLSNWPAFLGRGPEAIEHFEVLLDQQEETATRPEFAMTYLFLGNLYQANGEKERALETWRDGLELFPDSDELRRALELAGD